MKKLISIFATIAMVATMFTSVAYAEADVTFTSEGQAFELEGTTYVSITTTINAPNGFAGFATKLTYDDEAFTFFNAESSTDLGDVVTAQPTANTVTCAYASAKDKMPTATEGFPPKVVNKTYTISYNFILNTDAYNGDYTFAYESDDLNLRNAAKEQLVSDTTNAGVTIAITTGKAPVEEKKEATITPESKASAVVDDFYTQGFKAVVTPNNQIVSEVNVVLTAKNAAKTAEPIVWTAPVEGFASFEFAVNVLNVPDGETVTAVWDMTAAFAE